MREAANKQLIDMGPAIQPLLTKKAQDPNLDSKAAVRIKAILERINDKAAYITALGGTAVVDRKAPGNPIVSVHLTGTKDTDAALIHLDGLTDIRTLYLSNTAVTDAGLVHLKGMTKLQYLDLGNSKVGDAGLENLEGLTKLQTLILDGNGSH